MYDHRWSRSIQALPKALSEGKKPYPPVQHTSYPSLICLQRLELAKADVYIHNLLTFDINYAVTTRGRCQVGLRSSLYVPKWQKYQQPPWTTTAFTTLVEYLNVALILNGPKPLLVILLSSYINIYRHVITINEKHRKLSLPVTVDEQRNELTGRYTGGSKFTHLVSHIWHLRELHVDFRVSVLVSHTNTPC